MMKKLTAAIAAATTLGFANMAHAEEFDTAIGTIDASMTATLATDYIWRGQSQTDGTGAVQASLDFAHESGIYVGAWGSNVDSEDFDGGSIELDYYVGYGGAITEDISYDLSWATYTYPKGIDSVDELLASVDLYGFTLGAKYAYDPQSQLYTYIGYGFDLPYDIGLALHYGLTDTKDPLDGDSGDEKYADWALTVSKDMLGLGWALMYSDTDLGSDCPYVSSSSCDSSVTLAVSKSF
ncbi:TorF family putative porin [Halopseudomonas pelagia]|uniref:TorF family putative porin n=1 Tax=Halopseudomonas pelagia TaxID=553151 RepID=UPI0003A79EB0|nr:TorF family putative porin [Halopseudomonas pelagia]|tara:strand:+ start:1403 stop:2116 length:714 start_codon:yes stop_codon:yes gene_type:complete